MTYWFYFWTFSFALSGGAFVIIAFIVLIRGIRDLRLMFLKLRENRDEGRPRVKAP